MAKNDKRGFGSIEKLPSKRFRAYYGDPDGRTMATKSGHVKPMRHNAPNTFDSRLDAEAWLLDERRLISEGRWTPPAHRKAARAQAPLTFGEYAPQWLRTRKVKGRPLAPTTRDDYEDLLRLHILPTFADTPLREITPENVDTWFERTAPGRPTTRARAYGLFRTILNTAIDRNLIQGANPAKVRGGGMAKATHDVDPVDNDELAALAAAVPERRMLMVQLGAWTGLRFGELTELRRKDIDTRTKVIKVRRGVVLVRNVPEDLPNDTRPCGCPPGCIIGPPKTDAGVRDVPIPPHLLPGVRHHLLTHSRPGSEGLLFPGKDDNHLTPSSFYGRATTFHKKGPRKGQVKRIGHGWYEARVAAGRPNLHFHDLRHTGLTSAAVAGATLAELMNLAGHTTPQAALRYQHASQDRMQELASRLSKLAGFDVDVAAESDS
ncbi:site-specific integrase [Nocardioides sp. NPDC004968]|uniref:tyrosine-type recombinase/integrase n=1 Tax=Nocardioides sp. NPDC004968 TaxID=3155894 RepID=UPI0033BEA61C